MKKMILLVGVLVLFAGGNLYAQCSSVLPPIIAGKDGPFAGTVAINNSCENLLISIHMSNGWWLKEAHIEVVQDIADFPTTGNGNPKVGHFTYPYSGGLVQNYAFPPIDTGYAPSQIVGGYNPPLYIAVHVVIVKMDVSGAIIQEETGWAYPCEHPVWYFNPAKQWGNYFRYCWDACTF
jgi:hypothetical protein